jgi:hypothetical protein
VVLCGNARSGVHNKNDNISFRNRLLSLLGHFFVNASAGIGLKATRVNHDVLVTALATLTVVPIARESSKVGHDGIAAFRKTVKERGLAYIGASDKGQYGFQINLSVGF